LKQRVAPGAISRGNNGAEAHLMSLARNVVTVGSVTLVYAC
jgi:hypothetical protein